MTDFQPGQTVEMNIDRETKKGTRGVVVSVDEETKLVRVKLEPFENNVCTDVQPNDLDLVESGS